CAHDDVILLRNPRVDERLTMSMLAGRADQARGFAVHERDFVCARESDDENVRHLHQIAVSPLELLSLVLQLHLRQRLIDDGDQLLGPERLEDEGKGTGPKGSDGRIDARKSCEEKDFGEGGNRAKRLDEIDAAHIGQLDVDDGDVESPLSEKESSRTAL